MKSLIYLIITLCILNYVIPEETTPCTDIEPKQSSDCTDHEITEEEIKEYYDGEPYDTCCYYSATQSGEQDIGCMHQMKNDVDEDELKEDYEDTFGKVDDFSLKCESESDSDSGSIWLSLSLTFLLFGLLF